MTSILNFLIRYNAYLLERPGFRFKDSSIGRNKAEGSSVLLESEDAQIYVCDEREEITWRIRSIRDPRKRNWFSFDLISELLGRPTATGVMDTGNAEFLSQNLQNIIALFKKESAAATVEKLDQLKKSRTERL